MKVLILAGGKGERLRPLTEGIPKPMVTMVGVPIIEIIIDRLVKQGFKDVIVTLGYLGDVIKNYLGNGQRLGANITYFTENVPLGTAGAVKNAARELTDDFLVVSGDAYFEMDFSDFVKKHIESNDLATLAVKKVDDATGYGLVKLSGDKIVRFIEKPTEKTSGIVNTGIYALKKEIIEAIPDGFYDFGKDLFPRLIGEMGAYSLDGYWSDIGTLKSYYQTNLMLVESGNYKVF